MNDAASFIVIVAACAYVGHILSNIVSEVIDSVVRAQARRKRMSDGAKFAAARRRARELTEAKMTAEGYWDNQEIADAMKAAGEYAAPGYRP